MCDSDRKIYIISRDKKQVKYYDKCILLLSSSIILSKCFLKQRLRNSNIVAPFSFNVLSGED